MKRLLILLSYLSISLITISCAKDIVDLTGSIKGTVQDYDDGSLISNCQVSLSPGGATITTNDNGQFEFGSIEPGNYTLSFKKSGYEDGTKSVSIVASKDMDIQMMLKALAAKMSVSATKLDFGNTTSTMSFEILNSGSGKLDWTVSENAEWISCTPTKGTILPSQSATIVITVNREGKEKGNYSENIVVSTNVGSATIATLMSVSSVDLYVSPTILDFGTDKSSLTVSMTNQTGKTLRYTISTSNNWLSVSKSSGSITSTDSFNVVVSRSNLGVGNYDGNVTLTVEGEEISIPVKMCIVQKLKPSVSIEEVNSISAYGATVSATLKSVGSSKVTRYGICLSTSSTPTVDDIITNLGDCAGAKSYLCTFSVLTPETKYYVRAFAENTEGITYSDQTLSFTTSAKPTVPSVTTSSIAEITPTSAKVSGIIASLGNVAKVTSYGHVWGTSSQPTITTCAHSNLGETSLSNSFTSTITSLSAATKYYVRAYAVNSEGVAYGDEVTFTTKDYETPTVSIGQATNIKTNSFSVSGDICSTGGLTVTQYGHCWSTSQNPTTSDEKTSLGTKQSEGVFTSDISNLAVGTTYYVRAYAINSKGTSYSNPITVTTAEAVTDKWDGTIATSFAGGSGTFIDPYIIKTGGQLLLAKKYSDKYFELGGNIDLDNKNWLPFEFEGKLDGKGYRISNLYINRTNDYQGLFSICSGTVNNLTICGVKINAPSNFNVGAFSGSDGNFTNCHVTLLQDSKIIGKEYVGGITGYSSSSGSISNCSVISQSDSFVIGGDYYVGGVVGYNGNGPSLTPSFIAVEGCKVIANISGNKMVGGVSGGMDRYIEYRNCYYSGKLFGDKGVGGICGLGNQSVRAVGCKVDASITGNNAGGIFAYGSNVGCAEIIACYSMGNISSGSGFMGSPDYNARITLSYTTMTSDSSSFNPMGHQTSCIDCATTNKVPSNMGNGASRQNCSYACTNITSFLQDAYSQYASYWNFNNTWTWTGDIGGVSKNVSCPKLAWE